MASASQEPAHDIVEKVTWTSYEFDFNSLIAKMGKLRHQDSLHCIRNDAPWDYDSEDKLLMPFNGDNYRKALQERWMKNEDVVKTIKLSDEGPANLQQEITFWDAFGTYLEYSPHAISVFDSGICYSSLSSARPSCFRHVGSCDPLEYMVLRCEASIQEMRRFSAELTHEMFGDDVPSDVQVGAVAASKSGKRVIAGYAGLAGAHKRLVVTDDGNAWLSDVHAECVLRRVLVCKHEQQICCTNEAGDESANDHSRCGGADIFNFINEIVRTCRGVNCSLQSINRSNADRFISFKAKWQAFRLLLRLRSFLREEKVPDPASIGSTEMIYRLSCGVPPDDVLRMAVAEMDESPITLERFEQIVNENMQRKGQERNNITLPDNTLAAELVLWLQMLYIFRTEVSGGEEQKLFAIDLTTPYATGKEDDVISGDPDMIDAVLDRLTCAVTGVENIDELRPFVKNFDEEIPKHLAVSTSRLKPLPNGARSGELVGRSTWYLSQRLEERQQLQLHLSSSEKEDRFVELVGPNNIVSYKSQVWRKAQRVIRKLKGLGVAGNSISFELGKLDKDNMIEANNTANDLVSGRYGTAGIRFVLALIFRGALKVKRAPGTPISFVPEYALSDDGVLITEFLDRKRMQQATYCRIGNDYFWVPGNGLNMFRVKTLWRKKKTRFIEVPSSASPEGISGAYNIPFDIAE